MKEIEHWDEAVVERIQECYEESSKGDEWLFCTMCTTHMLVDEVVENDGYCMGCSHMAEAQEKQPHPGAL